MCAQNANGQNAHVTQKQAIATIALHIKAVSKKQKSFTFEKNNYRKQKE